MSWWERQVSKSIGANLTSEVDTRKKWVDGRTIYRKVIDCGALPNATTKNTAHNISDLDRFVKVYGISIDISSNTTLPLPYFNTGTGYVKLFATNTNAVVQTGGNLTQYDSTHVTLEYVK